MSEKLTRREARELTLGLIYEADFRPDEDKAEIYACSTEDREIPKNSYIKKVYFGVWDNIADIDAKIAQYSVGWKTERMSSVARAVLRLAVYEMLYMDDVPSKVSLNEAIELTKKYDEDRARAFVNGILNAVKNEVGEKDKNE